MNRIELHKMAFFEFIREHLLLDEITHLIYPNICLSCKNELAKSEKFICSMCEIHLPLTDFQHYSEPSPMDKLFWGKTPIKHTYAHFFFEKNKASQVLLFQLKYKHAPKIGVFYGEKIGQALQQVDAFKDVDALIPIPLHPKKKFLRGYNQSESLASGIGNILKTPIDNQLVIRKKHSSSQTRKSRIERWDNVNSIFSISSNVKNYNNIVLVDDVITTGSTVDAISASLLQVNPTLSISVVTLAIA